MPALMRERICPNLLVFQTRLINFLSQFLIFHKLCTVHNIQTCIIFKFLIMHYVYA